MPSLLILIPLIGLIILNFPIRDIMRRIAFPFAFALFCIQISLAISHHPLFWGWALQPIDTFFKVDFSIDNLSFVMLLCIGIVSLASLVVAKSTIYDEKALFKFINLLIIASIGMCGIVITKDLFSLYVFLEITAISSFVLIAFDKDIYSLEGTFKYLVFSVLATVLMLTAIAIFMLMAESTSFEAVSHALKTCGRMPLMTLAVALFLCGLFIKAGLVPFHAWLPDAYSASPDAVAVLLAGITTKATGVYTLIRLTISVFGFSEHVSGALLFLGALSATIAAVMAMGQSNFKRMLAYSSISQVGYIIMGLGAGTILGFLGAVFHTLNHSLFKSLLFVNSSALETEVGTNNMNRMGGLAEKMPVTGFTSVVGLLSASGLPPLAGFWSKLLIIIALWVSGFHVYAVIAVLVSLLTLTYLLNMQKKIFFGKLAEGMGDIKEAAFGIRFVSMSLALINIFIGIAFPVIFYYVILPAKDIAVR